jgi:hypothetical protein
MNNKETLKKDEKSVTQIDIPDELLVTESEIKDSSSMNSSVDFEESKNSL